MDPKTPPSPLPRDDTTSAPHRLSSLFQPARLGCFRLSARSRPSSDYNRLHDQAAPRWSWPFQTRHWAFVALRVALLLLCLSVTLWATRLALLRLDASLKSWTAWPGHRDGQVSPPSAVANSSWWWDSAADASSSAASRRRECREIVQRHFPGWVAAAGTTPFMPPLLLAVITSDMAYVREVAQHLYSGCLADVVALDGGAASEHSVWLPGALELPSSVHYVRVPQRPPWWLLQQFLVPPSQDPWLHQLPPPLLRQPPQSMTDVGWRWSVDRYAHIAVWDDVDRPRSWRAWNRTAYLQNVTTDRQADITGLSASTAEWASCVWPQLRLADAVQETAAPTGAAKAHLRRLFRACCDATTTTINSSEPTRPLPDPDGARPPPVADRWSRAIGNSLVLIDWSTPAAATTAAAGGLETEMRELRHALHTEAAASATATNASAGPWLVSVAAGLDGSKAMAPSQAMYAAVNEADPRTVIIVAPELDFITAVRRYLTPAAVCGDGRPPRDVLLLALRGGLPRDADGALQAVDMLRAAMPFDVVGITLRDESTDTESLGERSGAANRERNESVHVEPIQLPTDAAAGLPRGPRRSGGGGSELHSVVIEVFGPASAFRQSTWPCVWKAMSRPDSALLTVCGTGKRIGVWRGVQLPAEGDGDAGDGSSLTGWLTEGFNYLFTSTTSSVTSVLAWQ
ncbi:hypothetical protein CDCA_CDCA07G2236 [Cyanidium caldarium]|uniref:Uncharacterized protein n=1 Tax=Cyanidium caldarium TaxID=2771 RepID=A0AAV9IVM4_CYACA|nr:hypothetical protein CDCA_CDCA07G2236 [Cyanidium caldarium]